MKKVENKTIKLEGVIKNKEAVDLLMRASDIIHTLKHENRREVRTCSEWLEDFKNSIKWEDKKSD